MQKRFFYLREHPFVSLSVVGSGEKGAAEEANLVFNRLNQELKGLGGSIEDVVRTTLIARNQEFRTAASEVRQKAFPQAARPASASIIIHDFSPRDARIKIDATAILSRGEKYQKRGIEFEPLRVYPKALVVEDLLFISGVGPRDENIEIQIKTAYNQIGETMVQLGSSWDKVLMLSCYVKKLEWFNTVHKFFLEKIGNKLVPVDLAIADGFALPEMLIEVEATAYK